MLASGEAQRRAHEPTGLFLDPSQFLALVVCAVLGVVSPKLKSIQVPSREQSRIPPVRW